MVAVAIGGGRGVLAGCGGPSARRFPDEQSIGFNLSSDVESLPCIHKVIKSGIMRPVVQRGLRPLSWTRAVPRTPRHARCVQIRATPSEEPTSNGDYLPLANTPSSAESRGIFLGLCAQLAQTVSP